MIFLLFLFSNVQANIFFSYGLNSDMVLPHGYDIFYGPIDLSDDFVYYNNTYNQIYISSNGYITLSNETDCGNVQYPDVNSIALVPYFGKTDTTHTGDISFRETTHKYKVEKNLRNTFI